MNQPYRIMATFTPVRTDDLKPEGVNCVGLRGEWTYGWTIDSGPYAGQIAWIGRTDPFKYWVPDCDLTDVEVLDVMDR
jgi:hypothetical protein